jgi:predicted phage replisome organizer
MADNVQWIKMKVGMFDGNSFKKIKRAKIGGVPFRDKLTAVWFELLDLAGKSNRNGFLVDSNEIPYHTYEDIACMLDREEKEIELCMTFFINEQMVEIIDDIYCLSNFDRYQCIEGLEKIREQKRISQAKWRERKKLGLIGTKSVDTNVDTTDNLPSISHSYSTSNSNIQEDLSWFLDKYNIQVDSYNGELGSYDFKKLDEYMQKSSWLRDYIKCTSTLCKMYSKIMTGQYNDMKFKKADNEEMDDREYLVKVGKFSQEYVDGLTDEEAKEKANKWKKLMGVNI